MHKHRKLLVVIYIALLVSSFFYVKSVLRGVPVAIGDNSDKKAIKIKPVQVTLTVSGPGVSKKYTQKLSNNDSVSDLLLNIREENPEFVFDKIAYSYGSEFEHVFNIKNTEGKSWKIYDGNTDITLKIDKIKLEDGKNYILVYEKSTQISTPQ